jgi:hypothetical protein
MQKTFTEALHSSDVFHCAPSVYSPRSMLGAINDWSLKELLKPTSFRPSIKISYPWLSSDADSGSVAVDMSPLTIICSYFTSSADIRR